MRVTGLYQMNQLQRTPFSRARLPAGGYVTGHSRGPLLPETFEFFRDSKYAVILRSLADGDTRRGIAREHRRHSGLRASFVL